MKYRSPSPDNGLPTPPQSPTTLQVAHPATALLESLEQFYQQERYWVHHTRAALELALTKGIDAPPAADAPSPSSSSQSAPSPAPSTASDATAVEAPVVKMETDAPIPPPPSRSAQHTRWMRRKNMMRLKLDGISRKRRPLRAPPTEPAARLLEMFSELMDARMESCQRSAADGRMWIRTYTPFLSRSSATSLDCAQRAPSAPPLAEADGAPGEP
ncbi:hypothetical protein OH77DRAFT_1591763 [Trametes cingulata]|nr:hypothetical protein OH77DRAFT_1591763 [Trametes cingulata]